MADKHPFRLAVEARDLDALAASLAPDVVFHAPIRFKPFRGRDEAIGALSFAGAAFGFSDDFEYVNELSGDGVTALYFQTKLDGSFLEGVDYLILDEAGLVRELRIMMRPLSAMQRYVDFIRERIAADAATDSTSPG